MSWASGEAAVVAHHRCDSAAARSRRTARAGAVGGQHEVAEEGAEVVAVALEHAAQDVAVAVDVVDLDAVDHVMTSAPPGRGTSPDHRRRRATVMLSTPGPVGDEAVGVGQVDDEAAVLGGADGQVGAGDRPGVGEDESAGGRSSWPP